MTSRSVAFATAVALVASGCSIVTTKGAPGQIGGPTPPDCTTSKAAVYFDGVVSGGAVATSLFLGLAALAKSDRREDLGYATLFTFLGGVGFSVSALVGGVRVRSCRKANETWRAMQQPPAYAPMAPGAYPYPNGAPPPGLPPAPSAPPPAPSAPPQ